jgi:uncharacterized protein (TIGR03435 family)
MKRVAILALMAVAGFAQNQPKFEVASVKVAPPRESATMKCNGGPGTSDPERLICTNAALTMLVCLAYNIQFYQLKGPDWMNWGGSTGGYDIIAKIPEGTTKEQYRMMFQGMLAERFRLVMHLETQERSQYSLMPGKSLKITSSSGTSPINPNPLAMTTVKEHVRVEATRASLQKLVGLLTMFVGSPVLDETGMAGEYDFKLEFAPDERWRGFSTTSGADDAQTLEAAIKDQLGLKLEKTKRPLDVLVVDRVDKAPTEN